MTITFKTCTKKTTKKDLLTLTTKPTAQPKVPPPPQNPQFNLLRELPLELLGHFFKQLDFYSIGPLLEAFPEFKQYTLIVGRHDLPDRDHFFKIEGVTTLPYYPHKMRENPLLKNRNILLVLVDIAADHEGTTEENFGDKMPESVRVVNHTERFTLPVYERILRAKQAVFVHIMRPFVSTRQSNHYKMKEELLHKGFPVLERFGSGKRAQEYCLDETSPKHFNGFGNSVSIKGVHVISDLDLGAVEKLIVEFPVRHPLIVQEFSRITAPNLKELHIRYHTVPPRIHSIMLPPHRAGHETMCSIVDLDTDAWNVHSSVISEDDLTMATKRVQEGINWSFAAPFTCVHISGPTSTLILHHLNLNLVEELIVIETGEQPDVEDQKPLETWRLACLTFRTRSKVATVPHFWSGELGNINISSSGQEFHFVHLLENGAENLAFLSVMASGHEVDEIKSEMFNSFAHNLEMICLDGVPSPFLKDETLQLLDLWDASFTRVPKLESSGDMLEIKALQYSTNLRALRICQDRRENDPWDCLNVLWQPTIWDEELALWIEGFQGSFELGRDEDAAYFPSMADMRPFRFGFAELTTSDEDGSTFVTECNFVHLEDDL